MAIKWLAGKIPGQRDDLFPGGTEQDRAGFHCATQNSACLKLKSYILSISEFST